MVAGLVVGETSFAAMGSPANGQGEAELDPDHPRMDPASASQYDQPCPRLPMKHSEERRLERGLASIAFRLRPLSARLSGSRVPAERVAAEGRGEAPGTTSTTQ